MARDTNNRHFFGRFCKINQEVIDYKMTWINVMQQCTKAQIKAKWEWYQTNKDKTQTNLTEYPSQKQRFK